MAIASIHLQSSAAVNHFDGAVSGAQSEITRNTLKVQPPISGRNVKRCVSWNMNHKRSRAITFLRCGDHRNSRALLFRLDLYLLNLLLVIASLCRRVHYFRLIPAVNGHGAIESYDVDARRTGHGKTFRLPLNQTLVATSLASTLAGALSFTQSFSFPNSLTFSANLPAHFFTHHLPRLAFNFSLRAHYFPLRFANGSLNFLLHLDTSFTVHLW